MTFSDAPYVTLVEWEDPAKQTETSRTYIPLKGNETDLAVLEKDIKSILSYRYKLEMVPLKEYEVDILTKLSKPTHLPHHTKLQGKLDYVNRRGDMLREGAIKRVCKGFFDREWYVFDYERSSLRTLMLESLELVKVIIYDGEGVFEIFMAWNEENEKTLKDLEVWMKGQEYGQKVIFDFKNKFSYEDYQRHDDWYVKNTGGRKPVLISGVLDLEKTLKKFSEDFRFEFIAEALKNGGVAKFFNKVKN